MKDSKGAIDANSADINTADENSATKIAEEIFQAAIEQSISDVHIQQLRDGVLVRFRANGIMQDEMLLELELGRRLCNHLKVLAHLNIADRRRPQDGRLFYEGGSTRVDIRIAALPTIHGENITLRIFDKSAAFRDLSEIGLEDQDYQSIQDLLRSPHGLILVTGPTGAGKSTSLYAMLDRINNTERNIITVEEPVEYDLDRVNQIGINRRLGMDFSQCLRAVFRHDPDVIMVGEIRDAETAQIAIRAALSGHLVFSTLHTGSTFGAVDTLVQMGISPFSLSNALIGVVSQQLVRSLCPHCKESFDFPIDNLGDIEQKQFLKAVKLNEKPQFSIGLGCENCNESGYSGRTGIYEILTVNQQLRKLLANGASRKEVESAASESGWRSLQLSGFCKIVRGESTIEEILRVVPIEEGLDLPIDSRRLDMECT